VPYSTSFVLDELGSHGPRQSKVEGSSSRRGHGSGANTGPGPVQVEVKGSDGRLHPGDVDSPSWKIPK
jgi:hypothetical protein